MLEEALSWRAFRRRLEKGGTDGQKASLDGDPKGSREVGRLAINARRRLDSLILFLQDGEEMIDWRTVWAAACKLAGLPDNRLHDCRRIAARNLIRSGTPERAAMQLTGHKTRSVFDR